MWAQRSGRDRGAGPGRHAPPNRCAFLPERARRDMDTVPVPGARAASARGRSTRSPTRAARWSPSTARPRRRTNAATTSTTSRPTSPTTGRRARPSTPPRPTRSSTSPRSHTPRTTPARGCSATTSRARTTSSTPPAAGARIAWASSESCYGTAFAAGDWLPDRLPIDEATPTEPEDPCGLSKVVGEAVAASAARRHGVPAVSLRLSWVTYPDDERRREARETFDPATAEPSGNCWSSVDVRDVVAAIEADSHRSATSTATSPSSTARRRGGCSGGS